MSLNNYQIKNALISVSDKTGIIDLAKHLTQLGIVIYSTGGTATYLAQNNISVKNIAELTQFPEILDGRVKTLHPAIHAGLLADLSNPTHLQTINELNLISIDLVVVNLYPFEECLKRENSFSNVSPLLIENIDIGGPTMLRSAAKNYK